MGRHAVQELLRHHPERLIEVCTSRDLGGDPIVEELTKRGIPVRTGDRELLNELARSESHQSIVAHLREQPQLGISELEERCAGSPDTPGVLLFLDQIFDPQNLGAILRAAECFGVEGVVWSKNRGAGFSPVVAKSSAGASELLPTYVVSNLGDAIIRVKKHGYWAVTTELSPRAVALDSADLPKRIALVLGSEGEGVAHRISEMADFRVFIPMYGKIESLNVAQAAAVVLHHFRTRIGG